MFHLTDEEQGFVGIIQGTASLGRLTRLKEYSCEALGTKVAPVCSHRASIVATDFVAHAMEDNSPW